MSKYKKAEQERQTKLIHSKNPIFYGDKGGGIFGRRKNRETREVREMKYDFVLQKTENNLFEDIQNPAIKYFRENGIKWWSGRVGKPTGHILSSQVACINHLFAIRNDKNTVLKMLNKVTKKSFTEVLEIDCDENPSYISFEVVSDIDYLKEETSTRGSNCTSIDALILAKDQNDEIWLIPIEWKYTEHYGNTDKSTEVRKDKSTGEELNAGKKRLSRYSELISKSEQLKFKKDDYTSSVYFFEPFYQLMRQTLWAEQMIKHNKTERLKAVKFLHIHVIPKKNGSLLDKEYKKCSGENMEKTWRDCLKDQSKYQIVDPKEIVNIIKETVITKT